MKTLADELMGFNPIPPTPTGRIHLMRDEDDPQSGQSLSTQILEWCKFAPGVVDMQMVVHEFGITPSQATTYLQRFHRRGFLKRSHKVKSAGQRPMQVWKYNHE